MVKQAEKFVAILVDGDVEKSLCAKYGANGFPHTVFVDSKGKVLGEVGGYVETNIFLGRIEAAAKKAGPARPKKEAKDLEEAGKALAKAREKKEWKAVLRAVVAIEKIKHEGEILDAATEARKEAVAEARKRVDEAKDLIKADKKEEARKILQKVASEFDGLDEAKEAKDLAKELEPPPADDGKGKK